MSHKKISQSRCQWQNDNEFYITLESCTIGYLDHVTTGAAKTGTVSLPMGGTTFSCATSYYVSIARVKKLKLTGAADLPNVWENLVAEIVNKLKGRLAQNFASMEAKELLAEEPWAGN